MRLAPLPGVFQPPRDSWMVVEQIGSESLPCGASALDLCTGSGVLAIAAALRGAPRVAAVDISRQAVAAARLNARLNGVKVRSIRGDLFAPVAGERFDLIVSNPPYVPSPPGAAAPRGRSRAWEGGPNGRLFIDRICSEVADHLKPGGVLLLVHSSVCGEQATLDALERRGLRAGTVRRERGRFGALMRARLGWLRQQGAAPDCEVEDLLVIRGTR
jgi:release factor glutamine methyltransferase